MSKPAELLAELVAAGRPLNAHELAARLDWPIARVRDCMYQLEARGSIVMAEGENPRKQNQRYVPYKPRPVAAPRASVLTAPVWVPPKPLHRPTYEVSEGVKVRSFYDGELV